MQKGFDYESGIYANGRIWAKFWCDRRCLPFDWTIFELNARCLEKFPKAEMVSIVRTPYVGDPNKVWWTVNWIKDFEKEKVV